MKVEIIEDKAYVNLKINNVEKEIELKDITNFEQDYLLSNISTILTTEIMNCIDFNTVYKGIQSLINLYWEWQINPFKNEELSTFNKYRFRYELKIDDQNFKIFFDWKEFEANAEEIQSLFHHKIFDTMFQSLALKVREQLEDLKFTKLAATIQCACAKTAVDLWDNM